MYKSTKNLSTKSFETFVDYVLEKKASKYNKKIIFGHSEYVNINGSRLLLEFDAFAPEGFELYEGQVIFELKPLSLDEKAIFDFVKRTQNSINYRNATFVYITNFQSQLDSRIIKDNKIIIWDERIIAEWVDEYKIDYINANSQLVDSRSRKETKSVEILNKITLKDFENYNSFNISRLKNVVDKDEPQPFAIVLGAGVSKDIGAMDWNDLLKMLGEKLANNSLSSDPKKLAEKLGNNSLTTAQLFMDIYNSKEKFLWDIHESLYPPESSFTIDDTKTLAAVARLAYKCQSYRHFRIITYN